MSRELLHEATVISNALVSEGSKASLVVLQSAVFPAENERDAPHQGQETTLATLALFNPRASVVVDFFVKVVVVAFIAEGCAFDLTGSATSEHCE